MNQNNKEIETIGKYLRNEMSKEERVQFEQRLKVDKELAKQVNEMKAIEEGIRKSVLSEKLDMLKEVDGEMGEGNKLKSHAEEDTKTRSMWPRYLMVAASVLILVFMGWVGLTIFTASGELPIKNKYSDHIYHLPGKSSQVRSNNNESILKKEAFNLYELKQYSIAAEKLENVYKIEKDTICLNYAFIAYIQSGEVEKSFEIKENNPKIFSNEADSLMLYYINVLDIIQNNTDVINNLDKIKKEFIN